MDLIQSSWTNALFLLLAVLAGWIVLRFLVRLTGKLLRLGLSGGCAGGRRSRGGLRPRLSRPQPRSAGTITQKSR